MYFGLEVTRRCNLRCPHCFTESGGHSHPGPDLAAFRALFPQLSRAGVESVAISGGEPLLRRDLEDIMQCGLDAGIHQYSLVTNGSLIDPQRASSLARAGLSSVQVSVDGADARDHCAIRGCAPEYFYAALRAMRVFRDTGITVDVATILTTENAERVYELLSLTEAFGVRYLRFCTFTPTGRGRSEEIQRRFDVDPQRLDALFEFMRMVARRPESPVGLLIDHGIGPWRESGSLRCTSGWNLAYLSAEGDLYPCTSLIFEPFKVGNAFETPFDVLLASPAMKRIRRISKKEVHGICHHCPNEHCCGCRGSAYAVYGDLYAAMPYCNVYRRLTGEAAGEAPPQADKERLPS